MVEVSDLESDIVIYDTERIGYSPIRWYTRQRIWKHSDLESRMGENLTCLSEYSEKYF